MLLNYFGKMGILLLESAKFSNKQTFQKDLLFYFKSKDDLATAVTEYYQQILLKQFQNSSQGNDWESFIEEIFDFLSERTNGQTFAGCPYAVMGMETALGKPAVASVFMEGLKKFEQIFQEVLLYSGLSPDHAKNLSQRMLSIYQGYFLLGRISDNTSYLKNDKKKRIKTLSHALFVLFKYQNLLRNLFCNR